MNDEEFIAFPGMSAKQLAEFLKEHTGKTWEELCYFLIRISEAEQAYLTSIPNKDETIPRPIQTIVAAGKQLGWGFLFENGDINGIAIGNQIFLDKIKNAFELVEKKTNL